MTSSIGAVIEKNLSWEGVVTLTEDVVVADEATLTIAAGARLRFEKGSGGTAVSRWGRGGRAHLGTDGATHLKVLGKVVIEGTAANPVIFEGAGFGGVVLVGRGRFEAEGTAFSPAAGFALYGGDLTTASLSDCEFIGGKGAVLDCAFARTVLRRVTFRKSSQAALWICDDAVLRASDCDFNGNDWALALEGLARAALKNCRFEDNRRGADVTGAARLRSLAGTWRSQQVGVSAQVDAQVELAKDAFFGNELALEGLGRATCEANDCVFEGNRTRARFQQKALLDGKAA